MAASRSKFYSESPTRILYVKKLPNLPDPKVLRKVFEIYGELSMCCYRKRTHTAFIYYYDLRSSIAACNALNMTNVLGKRIKINYSYPRIILNGGHDSFHDRNCGVVLVKTEPARSIEYIRSYFTQYGAIRDIAYTGEGWRIEYYNLRSSEYAMSFGPYHTAQEYIHISYIFTGVLDKDTYIDFQSIQRYLVPPSLSEDTPRRFGPIRASSGLTVLSKRCYDEHDFLPF